MIEPFKALKVDFESIQDSISIMLEGGGSKTALGALVKEEAHIGMSSYPFDLDKVLGSDHGINENVVAYDGIIIINNERNPVEELTNEQISGIYNGNYTDWSQLGGDSGTIRPLIRNQRSGTQKFFVEHFKLNSVATSALVVDENKEIVKKVNNDVNSIGFIGFAYVTINVKDVKIPSDRFEYDSIFVYPSIRTIQEGNYPLKRSLRIYYKNDSNEQVKAFVAYIKSTRGQEVLEQHGLITSQSNLGSLE